MTWKNIRLQPPPERITILYGILQDGRIVRAETGCYIKPIHECMWATHWMELPQSFEPGHLVK